MDEEGRIGILMCAGCAFVCLILYVTIALTQVAMQDRRLVSCADARAGAGVGGASSTSVLVGQSSDIDRQDEKDDGQEHRDFAAPALLHEGRQRAFALIAGLVVQDRGQG